MRAASCASEIVSESPYGGASRSYGVPALADVSYALAGAVARAPASAIVESMLHDLMASSFRQRRECRNRGTSEDRRGP